MSGPTVVVLALLAVNVLTFSLAIPRFRAPHGWPVGLRMLSAAGAAVALADVVAIAIASAPFWRLVVAVAGLAASHGLFRVAFRVALQHGFAVAFADVRPETLVTAGPYRWLRHPPTWPTA